MTDNFKELAKLVEEHPELPIVPVIRIPDGKRIADCWIKGKLGDSQIETYCEVEGKIYFFTTARFVTSLMKKRKTMSLILATNLNNFNNHRRREQCKKKLKCNRKICRSFSD